MIIQDQLAETIALLRKNDPVYQEILEKIFALNEDYFRIMESLSEEDRKILEQYMNLTDALDERTIQLIVMHCADTEKS